MRADTEVMIFDLDGTLFNTKRGIVKAIKKTIEVTGRRELKEDEFDRFIGPPIQQTFAKVYGLTDEEGKQMADIFREYYMQDGYILEADEYPGMRETLAALKDRGCRLALATFKREDMAEKMCRHFGYDAYIDVIHGSDHEGKRTKPDIIKLCLSDCGCRDTGRAVMIGDSAFDAEGAAKTGVPFIGVTYGFGFSTHEDILKYPGAAYIDTPEGLL